MTQLPLGCVGWGYMSCFHADRLLISQWDLPRGLVVLMRILIWFLRDSMYSTILSASSQVSQGTIQTLSRLSAYPHPDIERSVEQTYNSASGIKQSRPLAWIVSQLWQRSSLVMILVGVIKSDILLIILPGISPRL